MIIVITEWDEEMKCEMVSHGVNDDTFQNVVMQQVPIQSLKDAYYSDSIGHWVITNTHSKDELRKKF
jgi:hypothetical protein